MSNSLAVAMVTEALSRILNQALVTVPAYSTLGFTGSSRTTRTSASPGSPVTISCQLRPKSVVR